MTEGKAQQLTVFRQTMCSAMCGHQQKETCPKNCMMRREKLTLVNWHRFTIGDFLERRRK